MASSGFRVGIEFDSVLRAISKQIYETPLAFLRENVQNGVDALRLQAARDQRSTHDESLSVRVEIQDGYCTIADNGIGMSLEDLESLFWTIGASGKRTEEAREAGCVGMFGIGGFANFGVCDELIVISQPEGASRGYRTALSRQAIEEAEGSIPVVSTEESEEAAPRGTVVRGRLQSPPNPEELRAYLEEFVQYAAEQVFFGSDLLSGRPFPVSSRQPLEPISSTDSNWSSDSDIEVRGQLYEDAQHTLHAELTSARIHGNDVRLRGWLRFESGALDVLKRGFKLCSTAVGTHIGISGALDCDLLSPTAGRDSLDPESSALVNSVVTALERAAVLSVLETSDRIAQHTRIFKYVRQQGLIDRLGNVRVDLADGSEITLEEVQRRHEGGSSVYFSASQNRNLGQVLSARGHVVVTLPADGHKQAAVRDYLLAYCDGQALEGRVECAETYGDLSRFERAFLTELEETILGAYEIEGVTLVAGRLTEDIPVFASEEGQQEFAIYCDVRHSEITKLEPIGINSLFTSLVAAFCREYLGSVLRARSPKFFGSGALNLDWLAKKRSELWVLLSNDIETVTRGTERQVVRSSDIRVVQVGGTQQADVDGETGPHHPKLIKIEGTDEFQSLVGYYLRVPATAATVYGDMIQQCEARGVTWGGNKITFIASDEVSTAFEFEVRLDRLITNADGVVATGGAELIVPPLQALFDGLYFAIPESLEASLVPAGNREIRIEVRCEWIDYTSARAWAPLPESETPA